MRCKLWIYMSNGNLLPFLLRGDTVAVVGPFATYAIIDCGIALSRGGIALGSLRASPVEPVTIVAQDVAAVTDLIARWLPDRVGSLLQPKVLPFVPDEGVVILLHPIGEVARLPNGNPTALVGVDSGSVPQHLLHSLARVVVEEPRPERGSTVYRWAGGSVEAQLISPPARYVGWLPIPSGVSDLGARLLRDIRQGPKTESALRGCRAHPDTIRRALADLRRSNLIQRTDTVIRTRTDRLRKYRAWAVVEDRL